MLDDGAGVKRGQERYGRLKVVQNKEDSKVDAEVEAIAREPGSEVFPNAPDVGSKEVRYKDCTIYVHKYFDGDYEAYVHETYVPRGFSGKTSFVGKGYNEVVAKCKSVIDQFKK